MYLLYSLLLGLGITLALPYYLWKGRATGKYLQTFRERLGRLPEEVNGPGRSIWIHAVSVGEVLAARPLIAPLKQRFPGHRIVLSTTTVTGNAVARRSANGADALFFAPFDFPAPVRTVLSALDPALLVLVETEIWPNLIHEARRRGTRVALVNGRISPRSFPRYRRIRAFLRPVLAEVDLFLMQGEAHAERIREMGAPAPRVSVPGNLKFDSLGTPRKDEGLQALIAPGGRPLWVAGSTVEGEEALVLDVFGSLRAQVPELALVVAPRHPERFDLVPPLVQAAGLRVARRSRLGDQAWSDGDVLVLDTLGELAQVYAFATVVFVGGSLAPAGGHNVLEAAVHGKPVVVGPHMQNFQEIADEFLAEGALVQVRDVSGLYRETLGLLRDEARRLALGEHARSLVERNRGALQRTLDALAGLVA